MALRLLIDTNRYRDLVDGDPHVLEQLRACDRVAISFVSVAELRAGFLLGGRGVQNERTLARFLQKEEVDLLFAASATTHHYGKLFVQLREQGTPVPTNDIWIAALAIEHGLPLYSRDRHFEQLPQIVVL